MRIGILGFAHGHVNAYCKRWREQPELGIEVVAGWDRDATRLGTAAADHGVMSVDSAAALLARDDIAGVVVASETAFHAGLCEAAAAAGKAIVLQKPMALTQEEADRIVAAVERHGVPFTMAWQMRGDPQNLEMKAMVDSGRLGRVFMLRRRHGLGVMLDPGFAGSWHLDPALNRDIWADDASHAIDFVYWLLGMPASVTAELSTCLDPGRPNDHGIAVFRYDDGTLAEVVCSFACPVHENTTEIVAERGIVIQDHGDGPSTTLPREPGTTSLKYHLHGDPVWTAGAAPGVAKHFERIGNLAGPLADFLCGRRPPLATATEGRNVLKLVLATYESSTQGRRVTP